MIRYVYDPIAVQTDPNLADLDFDYGRYKHLAVTENGRRLIGLVRSRASTSALLGSVAAAPSRPAVVAIEHLLEIHLGPAAFEDAMKQFTGRLVRQVVERLGGRWVRSGVRIIVRSAYSKGSIYTFEAEPTMT